MDDPRYIAGDYTALWIRLKWLLQNKKKYIKKLLSVRFFLFFSLFSAIWRILLPNLGILWFQNPMVFFGEIYLLYHAVVQLEKLLDLGYWYTEIFSLIISIMCSIFY
jgi:hypothetical protein